MRLLLTRTFPPETTRQAHAAFEVTERGSDVPMTEDEATEALASYDAILCSIGDRFSAAAFDKADLRCRALANFGVGYNHIDVAAAARHGVAVSNTPDVVTDATADIALTLMLMTARRAGEGERLVRQGAWTGWAPTQLLGRHLSGKRLGIVGMGRIGQAVARRGHFGFGMDVAFFNRSAKTVDFPATQVTDLKDLMAGCDVVVITVPGGNTHLIDRSALDAMQDGAVLVNVARGDVVDEAALIDVLRSGRISAGLDVYDKEPVVPEALKALDNVVLLPHLGTAALEVREEMGLMALRNLLAWRDGAKMPQAVSS